MKSIAAGFIILVMLLTSFGKHKPAYVLYDKNGKKTSYSKMIKKLSDADVVLFGELHNNAIAHWLQLEVTKSLNEKRKLVLGAEMFEADNQDELDHYLSGKINQKAFDTLARLWTNYKTDYAPLVNFAKEHQLKFIATNIPRRYARMVHKNGGFEALENLSNEEKSWIAPLPVAFDAELPQYKKIMKMMGDHGSLDLVKAQAIKDATMAHFINKNHQDGSLFIHYNGAFHSNYFEGILWYLKALNDEKKYVTISTVQQEDISKLSEENKGKADFIICVDEDVTVTY